MTRFSVHKNVKRNHETKDLAQYYYTNKVLFLTVQFMYLSPKTTNYDNVTVH